MRRRPSPGIEVRHRRRQLSGRNRHQAFPCSSTAECPRCFSANRRKRVRCSQKPWTSFRKKTAGITLAVFIWLSPRCSSCFLVSKPASYPAFGVTKSEPPTTAFDEQRSPAAEEVSSEEADKSTPRRRQAPAGN